MSVQHEIEAQRVKGEVYQFSAKKKFSAVMLHEGIKKFRFCVALCETFKGNGVSDISDSF